MDPDLDMKVLIEKILVESGCAEKRARMMDIDDFMTMLYTFNKYHIHFT